MNFSKSKYCAFCQCPKILWLNKYKPEEKKEDPSKQERFEKGNVVGDLAMQLFGDFTEVTAFDKDGNLDMTKMIKTTKECLKNGTINICEASFALTGHFCSVDILHKEKKRLRYLRSQKFYPRFPRVYYRRCISKIRFRKVWN